jgi:hypothetical protein
MSNHKGSLFQMAGSAEKVGRCSSGRGSFTASAGELYTLIDPRVCTRVCSSYICYAVDLIACARSTFGNDHILSSFFSFILTSNKILYCHAVGSSLMENEKNIGPTSRGKSYTMFNQVQSCMTRISASHTTPGDSRNAFS